jgi:hypothetical protein
VTVAVHGRGGVGVSTVTAALSCAALTVGTDGADVDVRVIAEVAKPEDLAGIVDAPRPMVVVFNKADLTGFTGGGPLEAARRRCADLAKRTNVPVEPMVALMAVAGLYCEVVDDDVLDSLRVLATEPADLSSPDAFVAGVHRLSGADRQRLVARLDLFGIAHGVLTLRSAPEADAERLRGVLRRVSRVDDVVARIDATAADVRYRRMLAAVNELEALAARTPDVEVFLNSEQTVMARMTAAVDVVQTAGVTVDAGDDHEAHLRRALWWRRYSAGPVNAVHRACGADITRGSLRLWAGVAGDRRG